MRRLGSRMKLLPRILMWLLSLMLLMMITARAQFGQNPEFLLEQLRSQSIAERTAACRQIFGAGMKSPDIYAQLALNLEAGLVNLDKKSPRVEELAWHVKALASSGDLKYLPLVKSAAESEVRAIARHARDSREILENSAAQGRPYLEPAKVPVLTEKQVENCQYIAQKPCTTSRAAAKCITYHQMKAVGSGANAIMILQSSSRSVGFGPFGGDSNMLANYYRCN